MALLDRPHYAYNRPNFNSMALKAVSSLADLSSLDASQVLGTVMPDGTSKPGLHLPASLEDFALMPSAVRGVVHNSRRGIVMLWTRMKGTVELVGGKTEGKELKAALKEEVLQEAGIGCLDQIKFLGIVVEHRKPDGESVQNRLKVSYAFEAHTPTPMESWASPVLTDDEQARGVSRIIVPTMDEALRVLSGSGRARIERDRLAVQAVMDFPEKGKKKR